jgi:hypothetical protein
MANIQTNPWTFTNADQASTVGITSITAQGASALVTTSAAHGYVDGQFSSISIQGTTITGWRGGYKIQAVPSTTTFLINVPDWKRTLASNGANGNVLSAAYLDEVRGEQALWDQTTASTSLLLTNIVGNTIWNPHATLADQPYNYGKFLWTEGLVINTLPSGSNLQLTVY